MYKILMVTTFLFLMAFNSSENNCMNKNDTTAAGNDTAPGSDTAWVSLFDGKTTGGWHTYGRTEAGKAWKVVDGSLHLDAGNKKDWQTSDGGDIVTDEEFENFHLQLEWKVAPKGNSGIIFYVNEDTSKYHYTWNTGPEMQVLDNGNENTAGHPDAKIKSHRAGDLYDLVISKEAVKPAGEWNQVEIISNNGKLDFYMNGQHTLSTTMWDDSWKQLIAKSKFRDMKGFGTYRKGKIALQDHGDKVWYRNIRVKRL